ncbi:MAG TPA: PHP domain-containing protein [Symbiobacteriaceae bacterium]
MDNLDVAAALREIADLLEFRGDEPFKVRAYRKAATALEMLPEPVTALAEQGALTRVPGIGKAIAAKITELLTTGQIAYLEELRQAVPPGVRALTEVPGLGARTAYLLYTRLGIDSLDRLELAARRGELRALPGMGPRKEAAILEGLKKLRRMRRAIPLGAALPVAAELLAWLRQQPEVVAAEAAGDVRRRVEVVTELPIVVATTEPASVSAALARLPLGTVKEQETDRVVLTTGLGLTIPVALVPPEHFALALMTLTGSPAHLEALGPLPPAPTEEAIYARLGLPFIPPELREGRGEVEAAREGRLPRLLEVADLKGDLHTHTRASDGTATLLEMVEAARQMGHRYLAVCDHSQSLAVARGLTPERLRAQGEEIRRLNRDLGDFRILHGTEVDIRKDGSLDFPDEVLAELDVVVASIHSHMGLDAEAQTERLLKAIYHPHVDIIGHPTGRVLGRRDPYPFDVDRVLAACRETGTALEVSADPSRLDLNDELARRAVEAGVMLVINTDAHSTRGLGLLPYGVAQARRAWVEPRHVVNTMDLPDLLEWLARPKG